VLAAGDVAGVVEAPGTAAAAGLAEVRLEAGFVPDVAAGAAGAAVDFVVCGEAELAGAVATDAVAAVRGAATFGAAVVAVEAAIWGLAAGLVVTVFTVFMTGVADAAVGGVGSGAAATTSAAARNVANGRIREKTARVHTRPLREGGMLGGGHLLGHPVPRG
jgi:hypothetical protein